MGVKAMVEDLDILERLHHQVKATVEDLDILEQLHQDKAMEVDPDIQEQLHHQVKAMEEDLDILEEFLHQAKATVALNTMILCSPQAISHRVLEVFIIRT